ncbi:hypothetical protein [Nevskia sp.]|uniref:hypothetical protein n=1 Tax=Nevskia sp. TaxID=1929292 RepID=UPI003F705905
MFSPFVGSTLLLATFHASAQSSGSVTPAASCGGTKSVGMMLFNFQAPFVSETFARRIAQIVIEEKYPQSSSLPQVQASLWTLGASGR